LYRDTTTFQDGSHRKDLNALNRDLDRVLILDVESEHFALQPEHGLLIKKYDAEADPQKADAELTRLIPFLQYLARARVPSLVAEYSKLEDKSDVAGSFKKRLVELEATGQYRAGKHGQAGRFVAQTQRGGEKRGSVWEFLRR
jgi:import inner membrane translocase subunit TIM50